MWQCRFILAWLLRSHLFFLVLAGSDDLYGQEPSIIGEDPWGGLQIRRHQCVDIPSNLTACQGVGYRQMRLPNLFGHDNLLEVHQQTAIWRPLIGRKCHPDTKLFLCSLFTPVCLDQVIYPCRSLCIVVKRSCEEVMIQWGYPWPEMLSCDQFPIHDVCMHPQHVAAGKQDIF